MIDYKEYAKQMRENNIAVNGILQVTEELWLQIADIIDDLAEKQIPKKPTNFSGRHWNKAIGGNCPNCNCEVNSEEYRYCRKCGQALDWGQEE